MMGIFSRDIEERERRMLEYGKTVAYTPPSVDPDRTVAGGTQPVDVGNAGLIIVAHGKEPEVIKFPDECSRFGRRDGNNRYGNDITTDSRIVSREHGKFVRRNEKWVYCDCEHNLNGTYYNGVMIDKANHEIKELKNGDVLRIDGDDLSHPHENSVVMIYSDVVSEYDRWETYVLEGRKTVRIGRLKDDSDIWIDVREVSKHHALIEKHTDGFYITDLDSTNGTKVNGKRINGAYKLDEFSVISICTTKIIYTSGMLIYNERPSGAELKASHISKTVKIKKLMGLKRTDLKLLDDISLTINPGDLVALLGGSGAGKTTLLNCLSCYEAEFDGTVLLNGVDLKENYDDMKSLIGYVPQQDIVQDRLSLWDMLESTAERRLPEEWTKERIRERVKEVIEMVGLTAHTEKLVKELSGGQRKRASIAVDLIPNPPICFLDEPTSGQDPEVERQLMHQLRKIATENGKTIIAVTHTLQSIDLFDKVIFLGARQGKGGTLCFFGSCDEARKFFGITDLVDAYEKISENAEAYAEKYRKMR